VTRQEIGYWLLTVCSAGLVLMLLAGAIYVAYVLVTLDLFYGGITVLFLTLLIGCIIGSLMNNP
jgi:hypothetical protein